MSKKDGFLPALFELDETDRVESDVVRAVMESIDAINKSQPLTRSQLAIAQTCVELARSIGLGNVKGRAIANEAAQLVELLQLLEGDNDGGDSSMPAETKEWFVGLATPPRLDTPSASYPAKL